jgi:glutathione S-transferase
MLELYHAEPVANSMKVLLCPKEKGLDFVSHYVDLLRFEQHEPWFVAINPSGQVPVLVHDGKVITESTVIDEYLDEVFPDPPLKPADPYGRARMRIWTRFIDEYALPALSVIGWHLMVSQVARSIRKDEFEKLMARVPLKEQQDKWRKVAGTSFSEAELEDCRRKLRTSTARFEQSLSQGRWLAGSAAQGSRCRERYREPAAHGVARPHERAARGPGCARHAEPRAGALEDVRSVATARLARAHPPRLQGTPRSLP